MSKEECGICGGSSRRDCPALEGRICSRCCGTNRGNELDCPSDCPHFPFGKENYDDLMKINARFEKKVGKYILSSRYGAELKSLAMEGPLATGQDETKYAVAFHDTMLRTMTLPRADGTPSILEKWESDRYIGLTNDESFLARHVKQGYVTVLEIEKIIDGENMQVRDTLFVPEEVIQVKNRAFSTQANRFDLWLGWVVPLPYYYWPMGAGAMIKRRLWPEFKEIIEQEAKKSEKKSLREYLKHNFLAVQDLYMDLQQQRFEQIMEGIDATWHQTIYRSSLSAEELRERLEAREETEEPELTEEGHYSYPWLQRGESESFKLGVNDELSTSTRETRLLANVILIDSESSEPGLQLEAMSEVRHSFVRERLEEYLGEAITFEDYSVVDLKDELEREKDSDFLAPGPDDEFSREEEEEIMQSYFNQYYDSFLDESVPALDGLTPREAAEDPSMRDQLIELVKTHLQEIEKQARDKDITLDISWILDELSLDELK